MKKRVNVDVSALLKQVRKSNGRPPEVEGPAGSGTEEQIQKRAMESARRKLTSLRSKTDEGEATIPRREEDNATKDGDSVETVQRDSGSLLDQVDAADARPVSESLIEDEERLSEVERRGEAPTEHDLPPPPEGHTEPKAEEPYEETDIYDEEEAEQTQLHDKMQKLPIDDTKAIRIENGKYIVDDKEAGEATQVWLGSLEEEEMTQAGFGEKQVTNRDLLGILKGVDRIIEGLRGEIAELNEELHSVGMEARSNSSDLDEVVPKVDGLEKDLGRVESIVDDENMSAVVRAVVNEDEETIRLNLYETLKGAPELLESALMKLGVGKKAGQEEMPEEKQEETAAVHGIRVETLEALQINASEGVYGETYIDKIAELAEKYGEDAVEKALKDIEKAIDPKTKEGRRMFILERAKFILENLEDGE